MHSESIQSHSGADPNHIHCLESTPYPEKQTSQRHLGSSVSHISDTHTHTHGYHEYTDEFTQVQCQKYCIYTIHSIKSIVQIDR